MSACPSAEQAPGPACRAFDTWIMSALCHHGQPREIENQILADHLSESGGKDIESYIDDVLRLAESVGESVPEPPAMSQAPASWLVAGLSVLCDWLGSNTVWFKYHPPEFGLTDYWETEALPQARKALRESRLLAAGPSPSLSLAELLPPTAVPSPLQEAVHRLETGRGPALVLIEDQTGAGKTEAALALAGRMMAAGQGDGLFIALPTMATANA